MNEIKNKSHLKKKILILFILNGLFFSSLLIFGGTSIDFSKVWETGQSIDSKIFWDLRFPRAISAAISGAALGVSGLLMQSFFRNPLAGPYVLGIHGGSSLFVALIIFLENQFFNIETSGHIESILASFTGGMLTFFLLVLISKRVQGRFIILIIGLLFGHLTSSLINIVVSSSEAIKIKLFVLWNLGSFSRTTFEDLTYFVPIIILGIVWSATLIKKLNIFLLGEDTAHSLGVSLERHKWFIITPMAILSTTVTAFCGPITFIGILAPHIVRRFLKEELHEIVLPGSILTGALLALSAETLVMFFTPVPINAILGLMGGPLLIYFIWQNKMEAYV
jgi:iron complex transport system permease protein